VGELGVVGPDGPAVGAKDGGIFLARSVVERLVDVAVDGGAVFAFELDVFGLDQLQLGDDSVICFRQAGGFVGGGGLEIDLGRALGMSI